jgi:hypothetical protein
MFFQHRAYWLPKDTQDPSRYEDAFEVDPARGLAAICDGVSSTLFSGRWADILAKATVAQPPQVGSPEGLDAWLNHYREAWSATIDESSLAWHQKPKLLEGAASTLLWIELAAPGNHDEVARPFRLRSYAIGDCCLFHVRDGQVLQTFPILESARFDSNPQVIRSVVKRSDVVAFEAMESSCNPADLLVLCTDAIGAWLMRQLEAGFPLDWDAFWETTPEDWQQWLVELRQGNQIRFDDSTMVLLRVAGRKPERAPARKAPEENLMDLAEDKLRGAFQSLKGSLRKGLRGLSESKWLKDRDEK